MNVVVDYKINKATYQIDPVQQVLSILCLYFRETSRKGSITRKLRKHYQKEIDYDSTYEEKASILVRKVYYNNEDLLLEPNEKKLNKDINRHFRHHKELYII
jgi:hypothetical protein